jgi:hypothetical protein
MLLRASPSRNGLEDASDNRQGGLHRADWASGPQSGSSGSYSATCQQRVLRISYCYVECRVVVDDYHHQEILAKPPCTSGARSQYAVRLDWRVASRPNRFVVLGSAKRDLSPSPDMRGATADETDC